MERAKRLQRIQVIVSRGPRLLRLWMLRGPRQESIVFGMSVFKWKDTLKMEMEEAGKWRAPVAVLPTVGRAW